LGLSDYEDIEPDDENDDENEDELEEDELFPENIEQVFLQQMHRTINITLGALLSYLNSEVFEDLTDEQRDYVFEYVAESWAMVLPPPIDDVWEKQIQLLTLTQQIQDVAEQKFTKAQSWNHEAQMKAIYEQLGWDFDTRGDQNDNT